jgi:hypothetical protein
VATLLLRDMSLTLKESGKVPLLASGNAGVDVVLDDGRQRTRLAAFRPPGCLRRTRLFERGRRVA